MSFIDELKRRNVFRVAIAYAVVAWLVAQVAALALESFAAPGWVIKTVLFLLVLGFPLALVFAWAFELTPEGLRRESPAATDKPTRRENTQIMDRWIIVVLILAVGYFGYDKLVSSTRSLDVAANVPTVRNPGISTQSDDLLTEGPFKPSIAVLPFVNVSDDPDNEYFSEGLAEELLNLLARTPELRVAARTSSFSFKGKDTQVTEIAEELDVDHILEGSVRKSGDRVRITVQLIKASDGFHVFSQNYNRTLDDIFAVQDEIASAVANALKVTLFGNQPQIQVTDPAVYALYLKGRYFNNLKGRENWENAAIALQEALAADPLYAAAWSELSTTYRYQVNNALLDRTTGIELARAAVERALALDENLAPAWIQLSYIRSLGDWDWAGAEQAMQKALQLEPRNADVLNGVGNSAVIHGRIDEAIDAFEAAITLDPLSQSPLNALGLAYLKSGQLDKAELSFRTLLELNSQYPWGHVNLGTVMLMRGEAQDALEEIRKNPQNGLRDTTEVLALISLGDSAEKDRVVAEYFENAGTVDPFWAGIIHAWHGDADESFASLDVALQQRNISLTYILSSPFLGILEEDPRWRGLLERIGLWDAYVEMKQRQ